MNITDAWMERLQEIAKAELTDESLHQVKRCLLDYMGVTYAGRRQLGERLQALARLGKEDQCSVIASNEKKDLFTAAMMNGFAAHVIELDDGHRVGAPHLEAVVISAMIGIAQKEQISFERFVKGILIGYEAIIRLSTAIQPSLKLKGFHATGVCGAIGAACAVGYAIGLDASQMKVAISAAATSAAGILQVVDDDSELKPYNVANAVQSGIAAAYIGQCGFKGPQDVLGGKRGFLQAYTDEVKMDLLIGKLDQPTIFQIYVKPYASCRHCHSAVECALKIHKQAHIQADEIEEIEVQTYKLGILAHDQTEIISVSAAKMSTPYSVAVSLLFGKCGMDMFSEECISREDVRNTTRKVRVIENERLTKACPAKRGAIVTVRLSDGRQFTQEVEYPLGEPENSISDGQLEEKYESLMTYAGADQAERDRIRTAIWSLEESYEEFIKQI